jgi:hypothetical protein
MAPAGSSPLRLHPSPVKPESFSGLRLKALREWWLVTRINSGPSQILSAGRSASQVVATLSSNPRGSQVTKPHLLWVAVQNPHRMHRLCSNDQVYRRKCLNNRAIRVRGKKS